MDNQGNIPENNDDDKITYMSDFITIGSFVPCVMAEFFNYKEFYVNPYENWDHLEQNQSLLNKAVHARELKKGPKPKMKLEAGDYVAAACFAAGEFHRVKLLEEVKRKTSAHDGIWKIRLLDYGNLMDVPQEDIRQLPSSFHGSMKAQAVNCTLALPAEFSFPADSYNHVNAIFLESVKDHVLGIYFHEYLQEKENRKWSASVSVFGKQKDKDGKDCYHLNLDEEFSTIIPDIASYLYKCVPSP